MVGGFGDYIAVPVGNAAVLPQSLSLSDGALVEPMACGLHALRLAGLRAGARILVLGAGSMALSAVYWGRRLGAGTIVVASRSAYRRDVAMTMGADGFHSFDNDAPEALTHKLGEGPDIVVECVGKSGMLNQAIDLVRPRGTVIAMGMCMQAEPILPIACTVKEVRLFFPYGYSFEEFVETAKVFDSGHARPDLMVSDVIALEALPAAIETMRQGGKMLKVHVDPSLEPTLV
jgi:(R,R)-butanediol dehydrogenase/meso-butanediol dehydrogenase/diacetyl reductase